MSDAKRMVACLVVKAGRVVQSLGFARYLPIGRPEIAARFLDSWGIDEICLIDIDARREGRCIDPALVARVSANIFSPLAVGGGISSVAQMRELLAAGADKMILNRALHDRPALVGTAAETFGAQCVIASVDVRNHDGRHVVALDSAGLPTALEIGDFVRGLGPAGVGEILLNDADRDGTGKGLNLELAERAAVKTDLPIILIGGVGHPQHIAEALAHPAVSAVAAANFWHFAEHSVGLAKAFCAQQGLKIRNSGAAGYAEFAFMQSGRLAKLDDAVLEERVFETVAEDLV